jgi:hypothetical protein
MLVGLACYIVGESTVVVLVGQRPNKSWEQARVTATATVTATIVTGREKEKRMRVGPGPSPREWNS